MNDSFDFSIFERKKAGSTYKKQGLPTHSSELSVHPNCAVDNPCVFTHSGWKLFCEFRIFPNKYITNKIHTKYQQSIKRVPTKCLPARWLTVRCLVKEKHVIIQTVESNLSSGAAFSNENGIMFARARTEMAKISALARDKHFGAPCFCTTCS